MVGSRVHFKTAHQHNRAEAWKVAALGSLCLIPVVLIILRFLGV